MNSNLIDEIRTDIAKYFDINALIPNTEAIYFSPNKKYFFKSNDYCQTDIKRNWTVSKIEVFQSTPEEKIFEFIRNDNLIFHGWLSIENISYLLLSEDFEGQSILDLSNRKFYSYSFKEEKFIWCEFYPSPDSKKLSIIGCYWACPSEIIVFDTSEPTRLPFKELYRQDYFHEKLEWIDNTILKISKIDNDNKLIRFL